MPILRFALVAVLGLGAACEQRYETAATTVQEQPSRSAHTLADLPAQQPPAASQTSASDALLASAYQNRTSNFQVQGQGPVSRILPDDNDGSRHQRFIIQLSDGQTLLIAHNIDLAPRLNGLRVGDTVAFYGEYEWNDKGGVIHWTHHDPAGRHIAGWLMHNGQYYQ